MRWYTTNYNTIDKIRNSNDLVISISRILYESIKNKVDIQDVRLAPSLSLFGIERGEFIDKFKKYMNDVDIEDIIEKYESQTNGRIFLLCYEEPGDFCHRHIVADYIRSYRQIQEYDINQALDDF